MVIIIMFMGIVNFMSVCKNVKDNRKETWTIIFGREITAKK